MNLLEKQRSAYHESGHIVITYLCAPNKDISKTTLTSPESNTGLTWITDKEKTYSRDKFLLLTEIKVYIAGFVAEKTKFGTTSNNVDREFESATRAAHDMTWRWGMGHSGYIGNFEDKEGRWISHLIREELDKDAQDIIESTILEVKSILRQNWKLVEIFAEKLIQKNELIYTEIEAIFVQEGVRRPTIEELREASLQKNKDAHLIGWDDVVGMEEVKQEGMEIVKLIKDRAQVQKIGGKILRGLLMLGPPGCGKTYLATAMANEAGVPFLARAGSEFVEMYVGVGASRIRRLFMEAKESAQEKGGCVVFIDEIDAVGAKRRAETGGGGQSEHNQTLNQLLVEMDGLKDKDAEYNIVVIGATNMDPDFLDPALLRPGRFDRHISITLPNLDEREAIFQYYLNKIKYDKENVKIDKLARLAVQSTPAEISNMVREAALIAVRANKELVTMKEINEARERIELGLKRKCRYSPQERERVAYHESGHAVVTYIAVPFQDVFKVTIIPRGGAGGVTWTPEKEEITIRDKNHLLANIKSFLAGYASEKIKYGVTSVGTGSDFEEATRLAYLMTWRLGMGKSGYVGDFKGSFFQNRALPYFYDQLDKDGNEILQECMRETEEILRKNWDIVDEMAASLIEKDELDYDEIEAIFKKHGKART
ncbi:MAG: AAA family ATPase [Candidatus Omnitrophota bacterium]